MTPLRPLLASATVAWLALGFAVATIALWQVGLGAAYRGGRAAFDRRFEQEVAALASEQSTPGAGLRIVTTHWHPAGIWRRQLLWGADVPGRFCRADVSESGEGPALDILCRRIEVIAPPRAGAPLPEANPDLADYAERKARWLAARALRMSGRWAPEIARITVTQHEPHATGRDALFVAALVPDREAVPSSALADYVARRLEVVTDQASGLSAPNRAVATLGRRP